MKHFLLGIALVGLMSTSAQASPLSATKCSAPIFGKHYGCIEVIGTKLFVTSVQPGAGGENSYKCSKWEVSVNGVVTHVSIQRCYQFSSASTTWGSKWTENKSYKDGDVICGWFLIWEDQKGCAVIKA